MRWPVCFFVMAIIAFMPAFAQDAPLTLKDLQTIEPDIAAIDEEGEALPFDLRRDGMKEAALSYGARGGLAYRAFYIGRELEERAGYLDQTFNFRELLIPAPSGLLIEPPIISEAIDSMLIQNSGLEAAVSDRIFNISKNARIVSAPRTWRAYLERLYGEVEPPPDVLLPRNAEERKDWKRWVAIGFEEGVAQADEIFQADLNLLTADYQGMIRYRTLLSQGMVSPPYALQVDRGITGGGNEMRVGDRAVSITNLPELRPGYQAWKPANR